jgi:hypothetical protein
MLDPLTAGPIPARTVPAISRWKLKRLMGGVRSTLDISDKNPNPASKA